MNEKSLLISILLNTKLNFLNLEISRLEAREVAQLVRALAAQALGSESESTSEASVAVAPKESRNGRTGEDFWLPV